MGFIPKYKDYGFQQKNNTEAPRLFPFPISVMLRAEINDYNINNIIYSDLYFSKDDTTTAPASLINK